MNIMSTLQRLLDREPTGEPVFQKRQGVGYNKWSKPHRSLAVEAHTKRNQGLPVLYGIQRFFPSPILNHHAQYVALTNHQC